MEPMEVDVTVSYSISKTATIKTTDYIPEEWEEYEEGVRSGGIDANYENTDWQRAFLEDTDTYGVTELLDILKVECDQHIKALLFLYEKTKDSKSIRKEINKWKHIKESCKGWEIDELVVQQE